MIGRSDVLFVNSFALVVGLALCPIMADAQNLDKKADLAVRLCVGGGHTETISVGGSGDIRVLIRAFDLQGDQKGEATVTRTNFEGLTNGINEALTKIAADEADKVRECLKPVRIAITTAMFGPAKLKGGLVIVAMENDKEHARLGKLKAELRERGLQFESANSNGSVRNFLKTDKDVIAVVSDIHRGPQGADGLQLRAALNGLESVPPIFFFVSDTKGFTKVGVDCETADLITLKNWLIATAEGKPPGASCF
jgi:hypothetical protein